VCPKKRFLNEVVCQRRIADELEDEGAHKFNFARAPCFVSTLCNNLFSCLFLRHSIPTLIRQYPVLYPL
jgi:hypothetical protein